KFASALKQFRLNWGDQTIKDLVKSFQKTTSQQILNSNDLNLGSNIVENWILETKFWKLLELLLPFNQSNITTVDDQDDVIHSYTSNTILLEKIIQNDSNLLQLHKIIEWIRQGLEIDLLDNEDDVSINDLQITKWLNTKIEIQAGATKPNGVKYLDMDSPLRSHTNNKINEKDKIKDELFFKKAFHLLLLNKLDELNELCQLTNNYYFQLMLRGLQDYYDPQLLGELAKPIGIKNKLLWKRTIFKLMQNQSIGKFEKGCYGFLCGDYTSCESLTQSWEKKLLIYLNCLFQNEIDEKLIWYYNNKMMHGVGSLLKYSKPPKMISSITEALNLLANDSNDSIKKQSEHPIRVLMGSIISNNIEKLMENSLNTLNIILSKDPIDNLSFDLTNEAYLLRILVHLSIFLQLIYGEEIISNLNYTKLLKSYITRLILYKLYDLIPCYIAFIPKDEDLIDIYSYFLSNYIFKFDERLTQLKSMEQLNLPMDSILIKTVEKSFNNSIEYYDDLKTQEITLSSLVDEQDIKLYSSIYWFYDSNMIIDCLQSIIILIRRFLIVGKIKSTIEFLKTIKLNDLLNEYKLKTTLSDDENDDISYSLIDEFIQYQNLINCFEKIENYNKLNNDNSSELVESINSLSIKLDSFLKTFLFELINDSNTTPSDMDTYIELRRIYIPLIFNTLFDILIENRKLTQTLFLQKAIEMIHFLSDSNYKIYDILNSVNQLKPFL
ncbi:hypothetical protein CANARDRAFT_188645, partial [[Candida] arabinofermentans NRRL YB-2248]